MSSQKNNNALTLALQLVESIKMAEGDRDDLRDAINQIPCTNKAIDPESKYELMIQGHLLVKKLCHTFPYCRNCPLSSGKNGYDRGCSAFMSEHPCEAAKILKKWDNDQGKEVK